MCLASNIRYLRKTREMTQDQLAEALGYKPDTAELSLIPQLKKILTQSL